MFIFRVGMRKKGRLSLTSDGMLPVVAGCLIGAAIGNKLAFWLDNPHLWYARGNFLEAFTTGQSIVGAILGGWLGVEIGKRIAGTHGRTGDDYVLPILAGIAVGRIGCFLSGLNDGTFGVPTTVAWGIDFGDGIPRHPTQLYEIAAAGLAALTWPAWRKPLAHIDGLGFRIMVLGYLVWRILIDLLKPVSFPYLFGLSGLQWLCILSALIVALEVSRVIICKRPCLEQKEPLNE